MAGTGKKWLLGCGLGCGIPILLVIVLMIGGSVVMMKPFNKAIDSQKELQASFGDRADFVPPAGGLTPERLEKFLRVRGALVPLCDNFRQIGDKFRKMDELDADGEEASKREIFGALGEVTGAVFGIAGNIGRYTQIRNEALLQEDMSLGEYIWIYTLVYNSWLGYEPNTDFETHGGDESRERHARGTYGAKEQKLIRQLMRNHAEALRGAGRLAEASVWEAEADHLGLQEGSGVPWRDSPLPTSVTESLAPFRERLDLLYCEATASLEFSQVHKRGLTITSE